MSYQALQTTALRLIKAKGFKATLRHYPENASTKNRLGGDVIVGDNHVDVPIDCVVLPHTKKLGSADGFLADTQDVALSRSLYVAGATLSVVPRPGDLVLFLEGAGPWKVDGTTGYGPDTALTIVWKFVVSR